MTKFGLLVVLSVSTVGLLASLYTVGFPRVLMETTLEMQILVIFRLLVSYVMGILLFRNLGERSPIRLPFALGAFLMPAYVLLVNSLYPFPGWQLPFLFIITPLMIFCGLDEGAPKRVSETLGRLSFPMYAIHFPLMQLAWSLGYQTPALVMSLSLAAASLWLVPWTKVRIYCGGPKMMVAANIPLWKRLRP